MDGGSRAPSVERTTPPHTYADNTRHTDINNEFKVDLDDNGSRFDTPVDWVQGQWIIREALRLGESK